ncbi:MAG: hypothetical protein ACKOC5_03850 [Chloroflexota bacterium]
MSLPELTFFCELESQALDDLIQPAIIQQLAQLHARLSLGLLDLSPQRAEVVRRLNRRGIPVIAWLLLPEEQGYWFNAGNHRQAAQRYQEFHAWAQAERLVFAGVGLDIEPDIHEFALLARLPVSAGLRALVRLFRIPAFRLARAAYRRLAQQIRRDGYPLESYQYPLIQDDRLARSTALQRAAGIVDVPVEREVWMLYTSLLRPKGVGVLASYAIQAQAVALGVTGGGVTAEGVPQPAPLSWDELARDLRLAYYSCDRLYLFSLEGCAQHGHLERLAQFTWDRPMMLPEEARLEVDAWRGAVQSGLWVASRLPLLTLAALLGWVVGRRLHRRRKAA